MIFSLLFYLLTLSETSLAACKYKFIHNASELIEFSYETNKGTTYDGYTVYLVSDINFNQNLSLQYKPIYNFFGAFDGQGYVIRNLTFSSGAYPYVGLFGFVNKVDIKNVILDSSCSFGNSYRASGTSSAYVGGIVGYCYSYHGNCFVENSVNMATLSFSGSITVYIWLGGIVGHTTTTANHVDMISNCVNYGSLYNYGTSGTSVYIGGIVGEFYGVSGSRYIYNCLNYGTITDYGYAVYYWIGGLSSLSWGMRYVNSVSTGRISSARGSNIGAILSQGRSYTSSIYHCIWTSATACGNYHGSSTSYISYQSSTKLTSVVSGNVDWLNSYALSNKWSEWTFNLNLKQITFVVHDGEGFTFSSQIIVLPRAERRGYAFLF